MQSSDPRGEWYEQTGRRRAERKSPKKRGGVDAARAILSVALCAAASYMAGGVISADSARDGISGSIPMATPDEASFVMSYIDGDAETETDERDEHEALISRLAEEYIRERSH